jgi:hypothetical protein
LHQQLLPHGFAGEAGAVDAAGGAWAPPGGVEVDDDAAEEVGGAVDGAVAPGVVAGVDPWAGDDAAGGVDVDTGGGVGSFSDVPSDRSFDRMANPNDVTIKTTAQPQVNLLRNVAAPRPPKIVWLDPPNVAPISAPLPDWSKIAPTMRKAVNR